MNLSDPIDQYCERVAPGLLAEPFNALTNLSFVVAALFLLRLSRQLADKECSALKNLAALVFVVGIGSGLFHTFAERWAMIADVVPIGVTLVYFLWMYLIFVVRATKGGAFRWLLAFGALTGALSVAVPRDVANGGQTYLSCLVVLMMLARHARSYGALRSSKLFGVALLTFGVSLTCRTVDVAVCDAFPLGTHFFWHLLNGLTLALVGAAWQAALTSKNARSGLQ